MYESLIRMQMQSTFGFAIFPARSLDLSHKKHTNCYTRNVLRIPEVILKIISDFDAACLNKVMRL